MMMVSDDCLVECQIDDDDEDGVEQRSLGEEQITTPPPPPEFASKPPTTASPPTPPTPPATPMPAPTCPVSRDPFGINQHLKVEVSHVLVKPASPHSIDGVWALSVLGFEFARIWTYRCLSLLLAVPLAFLAGILLAILASLHICHIAISMSNKDWNSATQKEVV